MIADHLTIAENHGLAVGKKLRAFRIGAARDAADQRHPPDLRIAGWLGTVHGEEPLERTLMVQY
jgi:hypothetical protein